MKQILLTITTLFTLTASHLVSAQNITCSPAKVNMIYHKGDNVYIQLDGQPWRLLGRESESKFKAKIGKALAAKKNGTEVQLTYKIQHVNGNSCDDLTSDAVVFQIKVVKNE